MCSLAMNILFDSFWVPLPTVSKFPLEFRNIAADLMEELEL